MAEQQARFLEGSLLRHITVMALTASIGLMAVFVVDLVDMIFISMLGRDELAAAIGYAGAILFFTSSFGIGMAIAAGALVARAAVGRTALTADAACAPVTTRTLFDIVRNLPEGEVRLTVAQNQQVQLEVGKIKYKIPGLPGEDFPPLPNPGEASWATLDAWLLGELVALTSYSMSSDDTRPHLAGTLFEGDGKNVRMVTTDGHRLSKAEAKLGDGAGGAGNESGNGNANGKKG